MNDRPGEGTDARTERETGDTKPVSAALVGATGGAGATRLTVEVGACLSREGHRVAAFDAAFATQGMADHVEGPIDPDVTDLLSGDLTPASAMGEYPVPGVDGELYLCPARAPFGDLARAKTGDAARRLERVLYDARDAFDHVLVDVPPVASNPAVAAVTAADRVAIVAPPTARGTDAVQRMTDRLVDVGTRGDLVVANRGRHESLSPDVVVPEGPESVAGRDGDRDREFDAGIARLAGLLFDVEFDVDRSGGVLDRLGVEKL